MTILKSNAMKKSAQISQTIIFMIFTVVIILLLTKCNDKMNKGESDNIIKDVKDCYHKITEHSSKAQLDSFLSYYDNSPTFLFIRADGIMGNYESFKKVCSEYYNSLKEQSITTTQEKFHLLDKNIVLVSWTGNIIATLKNGDTIKMTNYSITSVFKKIDNNWKVIHNHESAIPPEIIKR